MWDRAVWVVFRVGDWTGYWLRGLLSRQPRVSAEMASLNGIPVLHATMGTYQIEALVRAAEHAGHITYQDSNC